MAVEPRTQYAKTTDSVGIARAHLSGVAVVLALAILAAACDGEVSGPGSAPEPEPTREDAPLTAGLGIESEVVVSADYPGALAFTPDGRLLYNEVSTGDIRVLSPQGQLLPKPFAHVDVATGTEWGLLGLAIDPDYESNHYVYVYFMERTSQTENIARPVVMRFTDVDNRGRDRTRILDDLPSSAGQHAAGHLRFGDDGYLYVGVGDYEESELAQDLDSVQGKILRVNKEDGSAPEDNPFVEDPDADPRIFAFGFRHPYNFAFHPETGQLYSIDEGSQNCDEINRVVAGGNYGWPDSFTFDTCAYEDAIVAIYNPTWQDKLPLPKPRDNGSNAKPTGIEFVSGDVYPSLGDSLLICAANGSVMQFLHLQGRGQDKVIEGGTVVDDCQFDIAVGPDGVVYYSNLAEIRRLILSDGT